MFFVYTFTDLFLLFLCFFGLYCSSFLRHLCTKPQLERQNDSSYEALNDCLIIKNQLKHNMFKQSFCGFIDFGQACWMERNPSSLQLDLLKHQNSRQNYFHFNLLSLSLTAIWTENKLKQLRKREIRNEEEKPLKMIIKTKLCMIQFTSVDTWNFSLERNGSERFVKIYFWISARCGIARNLKNCGFCGFDRVLKIDQFDIGISRYWIKFAKLSINLFQLNMFVNFHKT